MPKIPADEFVASLDSIARDICSFSARQVLLRDTWYPIHSRLSAISGFAPNDMADRYVTDASFMVWELQGARGPKHKDGVKKRLLESIQTAQYYARTYGSQSV
jgi:hypothetical protein